MSSRFYEVSGCGITCVATHHIMFLVGKLCDRTHLLNLSVEQQVMVLFLDVEIHLTKVFFKDSNIRPMFSNIGDYLNGKIMHICIDTYIYINKYMCVCAHARVCVHKYSIKEHII